MSSFRNCGKGFVRFLRLKEPVFIRQFSATTRKHLEWSYVQGTADIPLRGITIGNLLQQQTEKTPDREAYVFPSAGIRKTFSQLLDESDTLAAGLLSLGLKKGDRVGIWGPNSYEWVLTQYATARAGLILVNINPLYRQFELQYAIEKVQLKAIIAAEQFKDQHYYNILFELVPELASHKPESLRSHLLPYLKHVIMMGDKKHAGAHQFSEILAAATDKNKTAIKDFQTKLQFDDPINIQFTSGTTGYPKGATLTHHNIVNNSYFTGFRLGYHEKSSIICCPVPLYHCFGMVLASLQTPNHGATCVFPSPGFEAGTTLKAVADEKCTALYGVPTMFIDMLNHHDFSSFDLSTLSTGIMAGSPCPVETMKQVVNKMHMDEVTVCYGTTENSPVTFQSLRDDRVEKRVSTVGRAHPHVEAKVVNEDGELLPVGVRGELWTRGYMTMLGYWGDHDHTTEVIKQDRWYTTGDIGVMDDEGFCTICGRLKDIIIRGGENINPLEVEQVLYTHPKIKDVQVVGVPDERLGEEICAWIELKENETATEDEIKAFCKAKVARFKVPRYVQFVAEFPLTVTGKVQKYKIRTTATKSLGLEHVIH